MIGVLGSSGHVGSLLADMLKAKGYELRLGSRSAGFIVNMTDPSSLSRFLDGCDAVVNCAGPAYLLSEPAARTAISSGVAYFDVAGCENLCKTLADTYRAGGDESYLDARIFDIREYRDKLMHSSYIIISRPVRRGLWEDMSWRY